MALIFLDSLDMSYQIQVMSFFVQLMVQFLCEVKVIHLLFIDDDLINLSLNGLVLGKHVLLPYKNIGGVADTFINISE